MANQSSSRKPSFLSSILSVSFVLFLLGLFAILLFQTNKLFTQLKETIEVNVFLEEFADENQIGVLQSELQQESYIKEIHYISKDEAKQELSKDFEMDLLEENPLPASFNLYLQANFANTDSLSMIKQQLEANDIVSEVLYQAALIDILNTNIQKLAIGLLIAAILFLIIAFTLIDSTIRLRVFSKRFLIKSMQLVGAKNSFIIRPFVRKGILNGFVSSLIALGLLALVLFLLSKQLETIQITDDIQFYSSLALGIILAGVLLSYFATWFSVRKYLNANIEDLY